MVYPTTSVSSRRKRPMLSWLGGRNCLFLVALLAISFLAFQLSESPEDDTRSQLKRKPKTIQLPETFTSSPVDNPDSLCRRAVERMIRLNIRLVALDFDLTIVDIHTGGRWALTSTVLAAHIRPEMRCLIETSMQRGIHTAVASFSEQEKLIKEILRESIPMTKNMAVRGGSNWSDSNGKRKQLIQVTADIQRKTGESDLSTANTILIDDDANNIRMAKKDGYHAIWLDPDHADRVFKSIILLGGT